ncbi:MAG TPA: 8-oxoguanine DNA glycosylase [Candidatus Merdicola faecigallinarum]|uniref:DNA-(apurinic or apyrimidinic site) lyase n=1 Tax=Candidatus Merdicola faecigallinarum TaxID=2840862 RepID=A0A9D1M085_9FIRM|nr:8-oxoguanine DNA glycosylase [Candidatus Merdicola faecigallinarum]
MKEQKIILPDNESFGLKDIFDCGQCFRWNRNKDNSYTGIFRNTVLNVKKEDGKIIFTGISDENLFDAITSYFDLERDYNQIKEVLSKVDEAMRNSIEYGKGIRILNQDLWETIISFIISANNNIPRIKGIIERLAKAYGDPLIWKSNIYYTFPTPEQLKDVSVEEFRKLGLGFRDIRLYETTHMILEGKVNLEALKQEKDTEKIKNELLTLSGVGTKVADCILLYSELKRIDVFPIDVWVRRVMNELYIKEEDENKVSKEKIMELAHRKFGSVAGIAQQYLYYWKREA